MIINMKKLSVLFAIGSLFVMTTLVFATEKDQTGNADGIKWTSSADRTNKTNVNDTTINRSNEYRDGNDVSGQEVAVNLTAKAYIPCYLKMEFTGNTGNTVIESFGPVAKGTASPTEYFMEFDNELGGFVDGSWKVKGIGKNAEVAPDSDVYIAACDTFKVVVFSNDNFKYEVISAPLKATKANSTATLNLIMGYKSKDDKEYKNVTFSDKTPDNTIKIGSYDPCTTVEVYHKFAVPYTKTTVQGEYTGTVTFKATTI